MRTDYRKIITSLTLAWTLFACSTPNTSGRDAQAPSKSVETQKARIDISYVLGHNRRRVLMEENESEVIAESTVDRTLLKEGVIDSARFHQYLSEVIEFVEKGRSVASEVLADCRAPYTISIQKPNGDSKTLNGCRDAAFNRLVNDGEFLLVSTH